MHPLRKDLVDVSVARPPRDLGPVILIVGALFAAGGAYGVVTMLKGAGALPGHGLIAGATLSPAVAAAPPPAAAPAIPVATAPAPAPEAAAEKDEDAEPARPRSGVRLPALGAAKEDCARAPGRAGCDVGIKGGVELVSKVAAEKRARRKR